MALAGLTSLSSPGATSGSVMQMVVPLPGAETSAAAAASAAAPVSATRSAAAAASAAANGETAERPGSRLRGALHDLDPVHDVGGLGRRHERVESLGVDLLWVGHGDPHHDQGFR